MKSHRYFTKIAALLGLALLLFAGGWALVKAIDANNVNYVSQIGGDSRTVTYYGQYAYLGVGPRVVILNVANPASPIVVQQSDPLSVTGGADAIVEDITIPDASGKIFVAAGTAGMFVLDVTNPGSPTQPTFVSNYNTADPNDYATAVDVSGDVAAIAFDNGGLVAVDISTITTPAFINSAATGDNARDVALVPGGIGELYAFVAAGTAGIESYEITPLFGLEDSLALADYAEGIAANAARGHAYVADSSGGLHIINIANPAVLTSLSSAATVGLALDVSYFGNYVFVADDDAGVRLFNATDETNPVPFATPNVDTTGYAVDVAAGNNRIYVADSWAGLSIIDFSNINNANILGTYETLGEVNGVDVSPNSPYAFSANGFTGMVSTNVSDRTTPTQADAAALADYALNGQIAGDYAYVADGLGGLRVVDISVPDGLVAGNALPTNDVAVDVAVGGDYAFVADSSAGLFIADITDPANPTAVTSLSTPDLPYANGVAVVGDYVYVAADLDGFYVVDAGDPNTPFVTDSLPLTTGAGWDSVVVGSYAYLAADDGGLKIIDVSDPYNISLVGELSDGDLPLALDVVVAGNRAVVAGGSDGAFVVDISNPAAPTQVGYYNTAGYASRVAIAGAVYVADIEGGLYLLNYNDFDFGEVDLAMAKTDGLDTAVAGASHTYTITVSNLGPSDVTGATVSDDFSGVINGVSWTCTATAGSSCATASGSGNINATVNLQVGGEATFIATGTIASDASGTLSNTATVTPPDGMVDTNTANNNATDTTAVTAETDLMIAKVGTPDPVIPGETLTYEITVTNQGPSDMTAAATLTDTLPADVSFVSSTPGSPTCTAAGSEVTCTVAPLASGANTTVTIEVTVAAAATSALQNSAGVQSADTDPDLSNNTAVIATAIKTADLAITKSAAPDPVTAGEQVTYTIDVTNQGPDDATNVVVADTLPAGVSFVSAAPGSPTCTESSGVVTCSLGALANTATTQVSIVALVASSTTGSLQNTAVVSAAEYDDDEANNSASATTDVSLEADLAITKSDGQVNIVAGEMLTYTITVSNAGPSDVSGALVTDNFPAELEGAAWQCSGAAGASCANASGSGDINLSVDVPVGGEITILASATVANTATGLLINTAEVAAPQGVTDPNLNNNTATDTNSLGALADVSLSVTAAPDSVRLTERVTLTLTVANSGPSAAGGVQVTSLLPAAVSFESSDICTLNGSQLTCSFGVLETGQQDTATIVVSAQSVGQVQQQFTVFAVNDSNAGNNTAVASFDITPLAVYLPFVVKN
ncbi:MAG: DUF11 domain-containing protein [Ardenticatenaceae bacterium]|nr:DUF11 domain-containing protein [Ardenticatenaceae bacterium]